MVVSGCRHYPFLLYVPTDKQDLRPVKEIKELQFVGWKYRALRATLPAKNANVIWLERNVWAGNKDGIRQCQQFVINYEDSIRCRHEMEHEAATRDSIGRLMIRQSQDIKKKLE